MLDSLDIFAEVEEIETDATLIQLMRKCFPVCFHLNHFYVEIRPAYTFLSIEYPINSRSNRFPEDGRGLALIPGRDKNMTRTRTRMKLYFIALLLHQNCWALSLATFLVSLQ